MKTTASTTTEAGTVRTRRGQRKAYRHECTLECGHVEVRVEHMGTAWIAPTRCKCSVCGK